MYEYMVYLKNSFELVGTSFFTTYNVNLFQKDKMVYKFAYVYAPNTSSSTNSNHTKTNSTSSQNNSNDNKESNVNCKGKIKGNANSKIYHVPDGYFYDKATSKIVWFCTEKEAQENGYVKSKR